MSVLVGIETFDNTSECYKLLFQKLIIYKKKKFFYQGFFSRTLTTHGTAGKGGDHLLFHSTIFTRSQTFRHLFATLHVRLLLHIFNRTACMYQTATR